MNVVRTWMTAGVPDQARKQQSDTSNQFYLAEPKFRVGTIIYHLWCYLQLHQVKGSQLLVCYEHFYNVATLKE